MRTHSWSSRSSLRASFHRPRQGYLQASTARISHPPEGSQGSFRGTPGVVSRSGRAASADPEPERRSPLSQPPPIRLFALAAVLATSLAVPSPATGTSAGAAASGVASGATPADAAPGTCRRTLEASVVALDQPYFRNRLGSSMAQGQVFSLEADVVPIDPEKGLVPGNVELRAGKRPRPIVLRMNVGDCLEIRFTNLLTPEPGHDESPSTRSASVHVNGLQPVRSIADAGTFVGRNDNALAAPGEERVYTLYAEHEGAFLLYSAAAPFNPPGESGQVEAGLFGAVNVQPPGAEWYRSQVTREELALATTGETAGGQPIVDYGAVYPPGHPRAGVPILRMLDDDGRIVHSDLTALVTGPGAGRFPAASDLPTFRRLPMTGDRRRPYREITLVYHEQWKEQEAYPRLRSYRILGITPGRDTMAINYGSAGLNAQVFSNRLGVGPAGECTECKFEEFFLSSWAVGDPAMTVDVPANAPGDAGVLHEGPKATKAFYPDDPSNVYHSYLGDPVKFRILHGGTTMNHVHHQHANRWLHSPNNPSSKVIDSQFVTPGAGFTLEMLDGARGHNQAVGDSIFHCHLYFHFAMGMWGLWRVHDVFEAGTELDADGRPLPGARALPDGEIARGTPIPAVVPLPTLPMPPVPAGVRLVAGGRRVEVLGDGNPGFPFFVPGVAGRRAPRPPLDVVDDGGLPRHVAAGDAEDRAHQVVTRLDFSKNLERWMAVELPEEGTATERAAMAAFAAGEHPSYTPDGRPASFFYDGSSPVAGAPFAEPCAPESIAPPREPRPYRAAAIQLDVVFNKKGWHYPQQRILALWGDVEATLAGRRPPEPLFFRAHSGDCIELRHTNLVPNVKELDDFQVRTPTDVLGQHIHLVSYDVLGSDGAASGWNYEDGTLSPDEVRERIAAINAAGGLVGAGGERKLLEAREHPYFGAGPGGSWVGAQTTVQRWYADPVLDHQGNDRTLRTVFTHDHYGASTHQQTGLFAGLLVEPPGSRWRDPETGDFFGGRFDGGPTSWRADVLTADGESSFREFALAFQSQQLAFEAGSRGVQDARKALRTGGKKDGGSIICYSGMPAPCPYLVTNSRFGVTGVNYRSEPLPLRLAVAEPGSEAGSVAHVFRSIERADPELNLQPDFYPPLTAGVAGTDPYTPLLRAYENDRVEIRALAAHDAVPSTFSIPGLRWRFEAADPDSGYRAAQEMAFSETFEFAFTLPPVAAETGGFADYPYFTNTAPTPLAFGMWGLLRAYDGVRDDLLPLPNNPRGQAPPGAEGGCPADAPVRRYGVTAVAAKDALPEGKLIYGGRDGTFEDPDALLYLRDEDLDGAGRLKPGAPVEPLILRAAAGDCVAVRLTNAFDPEHPVFQKDAFVQDVAGLYPTQPFLDHPVRVPREVGLRPQLVSFDATTDHGANFGANPVQTVAPGEARTFRWYAGVVEEGDDGGWRAVPAELGSVNLLPSDPLEQHRHGLFGALIVEPAGATWVADPGTRASATVTLPDGSTFREFVLVPQQDVAMRYVGEEYGERDLVRLARALNYRSEMRFERLGFDPYEGPPDGTDLSCLKSNRQVGEDPKTPIFTAPVGAELRFRLLNPGNLWAEVLSFELDGHGWQELPYVDGSRRIGDNPLSEWKGSVSGLGSHRHVDVVIDRAGGAFGVPGDYMYRMYPTTEYDYEEWGILRVGDVTDGDGELPPEAGPDEALCSSGDR